jgi:hypothetical protein
MTASITRTPSWSYRPLHRDEVEGLIFRRRMSSGKRPNHVPHLLKAPKTEGADRVDLLQGLLPTRSTRVIAALVSRTAFVARQNQLFTVAPDLMSVLEGPLPDDRRESSPRPPVAEERSSHASIRVQPGRSLAVYLGKLVQIPA